MEDLLIWIDQVRVCVNNRLNTTINDSCFIVERDEFTQEKLTPIWEMKVKQGLEHKLLIFKDNNMSSHINGELLTSPFH